MRRITVRAPVILSALAVIACNASPVRAAAPFAGIGVGLVAAPALDNLTPVSHSYIAGTYAPGATVQRQVLVTNSTAAPAAVAVYAAAASARSGAFLFAKDRTQNALSRWTHVGTPVLLLPAGTSAMETVTVHIPRGTAPGERYAVVWAAVTSLDASSGVRLVNRVGVRMYLSIDGRRPAVVFAVSKPRAPVPGHARIVVFSVRNTGRSSISIAASLTLTRGPSGLRAGPFTIKRSPPLPPGRSRRVVARLNALLPAGPWRVEVTVASGHVRHAASARLRFPGGAA